MATVLDLSSGPAPPLIRLDPCLEAGVQEFRCILTSQRLKVWIETNLPGLISPLGVELSPQEQLAALVEIFCSDDVLTYGNQFRPLHCRGQGVWELKTEDLRIFGWFPLRDHFIGVVANDATFIKEHNLYPGYIGEVVRFRVGLALDEPKFISSEHPNDVVSNYTYP